MMESVMESGKFMMRRAAISKISFTQKEKCLKKKKYTDTNFN